MTLRNGYRVIRAGNLLPASPCSFRFTLFIIAYTYNMIFNLKLKKPCEKFGTKFRIFAERKGFIVFMFFVSYQNLQAPAGSEEG